MTIYTQIQVSGITYNDSYNIRVKSRVDQNSSVKSFEATFPNENGLHKNDFKINHDIIIKAEKNVNPPTVTVFKGLVEDIDFTSDGVKEDIRLSGRDYSARLQDITIEPVTFLNEEIGSIARKLITDNTTDIGSVNIGSFTGSLTAIVFKHKPLYDCLAELANLGAGFFFVDTNKDLNFKPISLAGSETTVLGSANVIRGTIRETDKDLFNQIWVYGGRTLTGFRENFTGNGTGSVFTLQYKPSNTQVTVDSTIKVGGVFQFTTLLTSGVHYLVDYEAKNIVFVSGGSPPLGYSEIPANNAAIQVTYQRDTPIAKFAQDNASVTLYSPKEKVIQDDNITTVSAADDRLRTTLNLSKDPKKQIDLELQGIVDLTAGKTIGVYLPNQNVSGNAFDLLSIDYDFNKTNILSDRVIKVRVSENIPDFIDDIKEMALSLKAIQAQSLNIGDAYTRLEVANGSAGVREPTWFVKTRTIDDAYILGHPWNGVIGDLSLERNPSGLVESGIYIAGYHNSGLELLGSPAISRVAFTPEPLLNYLNSGTCVGWFQLQRHPEIASQSQALWWIGGSATANLQGPEDEFHIDVTSGTVGMRLEMRVISGGVGILTAAGGSFSLNNWHHFACTWENGTFGSVFMDGTAAGKGTFTASTKIPTATWCGSSYFGAFNISGNTQKIDRYFDGYIDEFAFYNGVLTPSEIGSLAKGERFVSGLLFQWSFDISGPFLSYTYSGTAQNLLGDRRSVLVTQANG